MAFIKGGGSGLLYFGSTEDRFPPGLYLIKVAYLESAHQIVLKGIKYKTFFKKIFFSKEAVFREDASLSQINSTLRVLVAFSSPNDF